VPDILIQPRNGSEWSISTTEVPFFFFFWQTALGNPKTCAPQQTLAVPSARWYPGWLCGTGACTGQAEETEALDQSQKGGSAVHSLATP